MRTLAHACALLCTFGLGASLAAQTVSDTGKSLEEARKLRTDAAAAVAGGEIAPEIALNQLRAGNSLTGLKLDTEADFAVAALDVGRRLLVARKPVEAEAFFHAAEASLGLVIARTPDSAARDKAQYLEIRALIRTSYLNKLAEGKADLQDALKLAPGDKRLQQMRRLLPADPAATLSNHKEQPARG
ncbi:MAG: hypothetical protein PSU94_10525 [Lacunisphaera sp.]|nr:hypothetical protein [Lacunisphaera sp.]